ncbi:MAG: lysine transporter LysE [Sulfobacillus benefaciens]|jgi:threonine/homoserine/homoserine lactone efflux protein|uniref:Lysine transporter LysE n=1 Tax=Sulfobacillus benefaciens TaxID=453960 RepID=A0A2T2WQ35_9FIRM|nr:MAG: lysine transporter LysE [Sulfobacillus benefaciens]
MDFLLRGLIVGVSIAAPVGPIGLLCIQRTVIQGRTSGFVSGLGAATADAVYGSVAGFGLDLVSNFLIGQRMWIHLIGGALLLLLGIKMLLTSPFEQAAQTKHTVRGIWWSYLSTFLLTITNPMTILSFVAVFAALGVANSSNDYVSASFTVIDRAVKPRALAMGISGARREAKVLY